MQEMWVRSLGWEDPLEKEMSTHSSILAWEITWTEEPGRLQCAGSQRVRRDLATKQQQNSYGLPGKMLFTQSLIEFSRGPQVLGTLSPFHRQETQKEIL